MSAAAQTTLSDTSGNSGGSPPAGWAGIRNDGDLQFAPVDIPAIPPRQPSWFEKMLTEIFNFLADLLAPVGSALGGSWWWLQWVLLAAAVIFALVLAWRLYGPGGTARRTQAKARPADNTEWQPNQAAALALLEDADKLAAESHFDAATRLLLQRSVGHISAARPDWVEPSSTARELAALPALPDAARTAFGVIAERVERSLFALRTLDRADWEAARTAYAEFALTRLDSHRGAR